MLGLLSAFESTSTYNKVQINRLQMYMLQLSLRDMYLVLHLKVVNGYDHITYNAPDPIRTPKLTCVEPAQYWGGGPPGNSVVLYPFFFFVFFVFIYNELTLHACIDMYICMYINICIYICMYTYNIYIYVDIYVCIHIYTPLYISLLNISFDSFS